MDLGVSFERQYRTPSSEGYRLHKGGVQIAQIELHYAHTVVYCSLILFEDCAEDDLFALIEEIDARLVQSAEAAREDLLLTVYRGRETDFYNDDLLSHRRAAAESREHASGGRDAGSSLD